MKERRILDIAAFTGAIEDINEYGRLLLHEINKLIPFDRGGLWLCEPSTGMQMGHPVRVNVPWEAYEYYVQYIGLHNDSVLKKAASQKLLIANSYDLLDYNEWVKSEDYNYLYGPYDGFYQLWCQLRANNMIFGAIVLYRGKKSPNFSKEEIDAMEMLYPHILNRMHWQHILKSNAGADNNQNRFFSKLTRREKDIVCQLIYGLSNRDIASIMGISENTVKMHLKNTYSKLNIKSRSQLFALYMCENLEYGRCGADNNLSEKVKSHLR